MINNIEIANIIIDRLPYLNPYIYHKALTGSIYIKFANKELRSLRIGDHDGREKYRYKWNLRTDIQNAYTENDRGVIRHYYPLKAINKLIIHLMKYHNKIIQDCNNGTYKRTEADKTKKEKP